MSMILCRGRPLSKNISQFRSPCNRTLSYIEVTRSNIHVGSRSFCIELILMQGDLYADKISHLVFIILTNDFSF